MVAFQIFQPATGLECDPASSGLFNRLLKGVDIADIVDAFAETFPLEGAYDAICRWVGETMIAEIFAVKVVQRKFPRSLFCLLYTSDAADE